MVIGPDGSIWVADALDSKVRRILPNGTQKVVGSGISVSSLALDSAGNLYAGGAASVWKIAPGGTPQLFAGGGGELIPTVGAPAMPATSVNLSSIAGVVTDSAGNVYALSVTGDYSGDSLITRITPAGQLTTIWDSTTMPGAAGDYEATAGFSMDAQGYLVVPVSFNRQILRIATDGSGVFQTLTAPDPVASIATSPSGEIFYSTTAARIEALHSGATLYNRDADPDSVLVDDREGDFVPLAEELSGSFLVSYVEVEEPPFLATDAAGNVYATDATQNVIRRFPVGSCFTVQPPHISNDSLPAPISPQPANPLTTSTTTTAGTTVPEPSTFAPGELMSIFGTGLGPQAGVTAQADSNGFISTQLAGTQVLFEGLPAPVLYTSDGRVNTVIPFTMYGYRHVVVQVEYNGVLSDAVALSMAPSQPIVFTNSASGQAVAIVVNQDGTINSPSNPAALGSIITFYGSGFGLTTPAGTDGHLATAPLPQPVLPVSVTVDGWTAPVLYAGDASGMVEGVVQVNLRVPEYASAGDVWVTVGNVGMQFNISVGGN
jgi:uncharacterized protein (TIGR03437 family)